MSARELICSASVNMQAGKYFVSIKANAAKQEDFSSAPVSYMIEIVNFNNRHEKVISGEFHARSQTINHNSTKGARQVGQFQVN